MNHVNVCVFYHLLVFCFYYNNEFDICDMFINAGDEEAMEDFIVKGGMIGTAIGPKGILDFDKDSYNYQKELQNTKLEQEAQKLWFRMRNEVISELQEKGYDVE